MLSLTSDRMAQPILQEEAGSPSTSGSGADGNASAESKHTSEDSAEPHKAARIAELKLKYADLIAKSQPQRDAAAAQLVGRSASKTRITSSTRDCKLQYRASSNAREEFMRAIREMDKTVEIAADGSSDIFLMLRQEFGDGVVRCWKRCQGNDFLFRELGLVLKKDHADDVAEMMQREREEFMRVIRDMDKTVEIAADGSSDLFLLLRQEFGDGVVQCWKCCQKPNFLVEKVGLVLKDD